MGITRFTNLKDAEQALWSFAPDAAYFERIRGIFDLAEHLLPHEPERGIRKYHSLEERAALVEKRR